jgi:hypothetical protein
MTIIGLLMMVSASSTRATDALVDDFASGTNENYFENFWYYWDDNAGTNPNDRPQAAPDSAPSIINVPYKFKPRHAANVLTDTFKIKDYRFLIKEEAGNKYASMPFTFGTKWKCIGHRDAYTACPFVGMSAALAPDGDSMDLTGATAVTFRARAHANDLYVNFKIETMDIIHDSSFAHYYVGKVVQKGIWTDCTVLIPADLAQPPWAKDDQIRPFLQTKCAKLSWEVHGEYNPGVKIDTLDIDDVWIKDYNYRSASVWYKTEANRPAKGLISSFENPLKNATPLGTYWFAYDDHENFGNSSITRGAVVDHTKGLFPLDWSDSNTGFNNSGYGASIQMQFGKAFKQVNTMGDTTDIQGFTGIGIATYDSANALYFNMTTGKLGAMGGTGSTESIYFEYLADGDFRYLTLEVRDSNDVPDKNTPTKKDMRGKGIVWYRNLPKTGPNLWRSVCIPFDSLITHSNWKNYKHIPLDKTKLATIQFRAQGPEGKKGTIQIDNVYFPKIVFNNETSVQNDIIRSGQQSAFRAFYRNGFVRVDWEPMRGLTSGKFCLIDSKGAIVKNERIAPASSLDFAALGIPAGLYFVFMNGADKTGKMISQQAPITILK